MDIHREAKLPTRHRLRPRARQMATTGTLFLTLFAGGFLVASLNEEQ